MEPANLAPVRENSMFCYGPLVSELGGPECMVPPNSVIGGRCSAAYVCSGLFSWFSASISGLNISCTLHDLLDAASCSKMTVTRVADFMEIIN